MPTPQFTKIAYAPKDKRVRLEYTIDNGTEEPDEYTAKIRQPPHPDFLDALARLRQHVLAHVELEEIPVDQVEVRGVSLTWHPEMGMGATITGLRQLSRAAAPLVLNTPFKWAEGEGETLGAETNAAIGALIEEAAAFLSGEKRGEDEDGDDQEDLELDDERVERVPAITIKPSRAPTALSTRMGAGRRRGGRARR